MKSSRLIVSEVLRVVILMTLSGCVGEEKKMAEINSKNQRDKREYRSLVLDNKLEALLIYDPEINKSSAALDVGVGNLEDPKDHLGLAHFLEHMLFLGTKKYPDVEDYNTYLQSNQGYSNAYTAEERTNYHFEVNPDAFEGALDRFAQFFIAPLFSPEFVEREMNAVHSEHQKNLKDDNWRTHMVMRTLHKDGHPTQKFSTGSLETLGQTKRETLLEFYKKNYSANRMKLVLMSKHSLNEMEKWTREKFSEVPNSDVPKLSYSPEIFDPKALPRIVSIASIKDLKKIELVFASPNGDEHWKSKPGLIISHLIGYEGAGSLLSLLKNENLANGLSSSVDSSTYSGEFHFEIALTDKGFEQQDRVIEYFFSYINMLRDRGLERYLYDELKTMSDINFTYRENKEGGGIASHYASRMQVYPALDIDKNDQLFFEFSPSDYQLFLDALRPEMANILIIAPNVQADLVETYYKTNFGVKPVPPETLKKWGDAKPDQRLQLPRENEFIPKNLELLSSKAPTAPTKMIDDEWRSFYFKQDDRFFIPKGFVKLQILTPRVNDSAKNKTLSFLYALALNEGLNEWNYQISVAGLNYVISRFDQGIQLEFSGYSENLPNLMKSLATKLKTITISAKQFEDLKEELKRNTRNMDLDAAYQQVIYELKFLSNPDIIHRKKIYDPAHQIDLITPVTLEEVKLFAETLYDEFAIEGVGFGSLSAEELKSVLMSYPFILEGKKPLKPVDRPRNKTLVLPEHSQLVNAVPTLTNNNGWGLSLQFGKRDLPLNVALRMGQSILKTSFFGELRTKQQLGYVVFSGFQFSEDALGLSFVIQSSDYSPEEVDLRARAWMATAVKELKEVKEFDVIKKSVIDELLEKDKTMAEQYATLVDEAITLKGQFGYFQKLADVASQMTQQQVVDIYTDALKSMRSVSVFLSQKPKGKIANRQLISDPEKFRVSLKRY